MAALVGVALALPALRAGWFLDDHYHWLAMAGSRMLPEVFLSPMDMFGFFDGDPERTRRGMDLGLAPWWTDPDIHAAFWRPMTVLTHWVDYELWPDAPGLSHAHSLAWFGALIGVVALLYRRLMGATWVAGLAALLWAIDDAHSAPAAWLANRNGLPAAFFGICALLAHHRWRRERRGSQACIAGGLLALSLLSGEAGIATCAYLAAYAAFLDRATWRRRVASLVPYLCIVLAWRVAWSGLGYGVSHLGLYVDPLGEPGRFLGAAIWRGPVLLLGQWALPPADVASLLSEQGRWLLALAGMIFLVVLTAMFFPLLRRDRTARFWGSRSQVFRQILARDEASVR